MGLMSLLFRIDILYKTVGGIIMSKIRSKERGTKRYFERLTERRYLKWLRYIESPIEL